MPNVDANVIKTFCALVSRCNVSTLSSVKFSELLEHEGVIEGQGVLKILREESVLEVKQALPHCNSLGMNFSGSFLSVRV
jgi:hypothetical protein